ncbi:glutaminase [Paraglaciecola sp. Hal342]
MVTPEGKVYSAGCADNHLGFSIQSISKVFTLTMALGKLGDALWRAVGREPSRDPFNSIVQLEHESGITEKTRLLMPVLSR